MTNATGIPAKEPRIHVISARKHSTLKVWIPKSDAHRLINVLGIASHEVLGILPQLKQAETAPTETHWIGDLDLHCRNIQHHDILQGLEDPVRLRISDVDKVVAFVMLSYTTRELSSISEFGRRVIAVLPHAEMEWSAYSESEQMLETKRYRDGEVWLASAWYPPIIEPEDEQPSGPSDTPGSPSSDSPDVKPPDVPF